MVSLFSLVEYVGRGSRIPDVAYIERHVEVKANRALVVRVDSLVD